MFLDQICKNGVKMKLDDERFVCLIGIVILFFLYAYFSHDLDFYYKLIEEEMNR